MATLGEWVSGARPRTLGAAVAPVSVGTGVAALESSVAPLRALLALAVALLLQIGVNYANDYSDGVRGTDLGRVGPVRLVGQGLAAATQVKAASLIAFGAAAVLGLSLTAMVGSWWLLLVGAASLAAGWLYTGGPRPYGYFGLGEVFVFVFFGVVPVLGTAYLQTLSINATAWWGAVGVGSLACAVLVANNLRDIPTDASSGKDTLAVKLGDRRTRWLFISLLTIAYLSVIPLATGWGAGITTAWLSYLSLPIAARAGLLVIDGARGRGLVAVLQLTGLLILAFGLLLGLGLALGG